VATAERDVERCRHRADLDMQALIEKLGAGFSTWGAPWIAAWHVVDAARTMCIARFTR
jgi:hypothetical protein